MKPKPDGQKNNLFSPVRVVLGLIIGFIFLMFAMPFIAKILAFPAAGIGAFIVLFFSTIQNMLFAHPIISILAAGVLLYYVQQKSSKNRLKRGIEKVCPHCRETIDGAASVCKFCHRNI